MHAVILSLPFEPSVKVQRVNAEALRMLARLHVKRTVKVSEGKFWGGLAR